MGLKNLLTELGTEHPTYEKLQSLEGAVVVAAVESVRQARAVARGTAPFTRVKSAELALVLAVEELEQARRRARETNDSGEVL